MQKMRLKLMEFYGFIPIDKVGRRAYTPSPHLPPLTIKVSQAEIEAGDCEGRLPLLFKTEGQMLDATSRCRTSDVRYQIPDI